MKLTNEELRKARIEALASAILTLSMRGPIPLVDIEKVLLPRAERLERWLTRPREDEVLPT